MVAKFDFFFSIVSVFLLSHTLRVALNLHEMIVIEHAMLCSKAGERSFPKWAIITNSFRYGCPHKPDKLLGLGLEKFKIFLTNVREKAATCKALQRKGNSLVLKKR